MPATAWGTEEGMTIYRYLRLMYLRLIGVGRLVGKEKPVAQDLNFVLLTKGDQRFAILYAEDRRAEALRQLGRWASSPDLGFSWLDAACLSLRIKQQAQEAEMDCAGVKVRISE
jgi:hypothetical protein